MDIEELREKVKELEAKLEFKQWGDLDNLRFEEYMNEFVPVQKFKEVKKEKEKWKKKYLDEVDKDVEVTLLYNELLNKIKNELKIAKKENYINETYNKESRNYWINQGKINLSKRLLEDK